MDSFKTPVRNKKGNLIQIPASPFMKKIGFGTGVAVYEMHRSPIQNRTYSPWAVKKVLKEKESGIVESMEKRLRFEAEILRKLKHPNIVGFRAISKDEDGNSALIMEECSSSLGDMIENRLDHLGEVPYSPNTILKVLRDISKALDYLHNTALLLHGDMKSFNVLIKGDFIICKLCDFGVCLPLNKSGQLDKERNTNQSFYSGTDVWSAPEILKFPQEVTSKADIYAFGLIIWEMIALSPPIDDDLMMNLDQSAEDSSNSITEFDRERPPLPDVDLGTEYNLVLQIYYCCTAKNKDDLHE
nr:lymphokine-activated killer T-cell-originated protein kinase homolog [Leptinotarsa decemlineata]